MDNQVEQFLIEQGHLIILMVRTATIEQALTKIVAVPVCADAIRNFFDQDPIELYWQYNLLPCESKLLVDQVTQSKYNNIRYHTKSSVFFRKNINKNVNGGTNP